MNCENFLDALLRDGQHRLKKLAADRGEVIRGFGQESRQTDLWWLLLVALLGLLCMEVWMTRRAALGR